MPLSDKRARTDDATPQPEQLQCQACSGGILLPETTRAAIWHGERLVVVEDVPALVCQSCAERYYEDETAMRLDIMRGQGFADDRVRRVLSVPVFSYDQSGSEPGKKGKPNGAR
ncbi:MAG: type II toxin-antitoxin system MqsA family antitoxin [Paracoccaceae bacterium]